MKFEHNKTLDDVLKFDVNCNGLFCLMHDMKVDGLLGLDLNDENFYSSKVASPELFLNGDFLCLRDLDLRCIIFDLANNKKCIYTNTDDMDNGYIILNESVDNNRELVRSDRKAGKRSRSVWNVDTNAQRQTALKYTNWFENGEYLFFRHEGSVGLTRFSPTDEEVWTHEVRGEYKGITGNIETNRLRDILGIHNELIWLTDFMGRIYSLHLDTGEACHSLSNVGSTFKYNIEPERNRIVSLQEKYLHIVDINDSNLKHQSADTSAIFDVNTFIPSYFGMLSKLPIIDSHVIFPDVDNAVIGAFDIDNAKVSWQHAIYKGKKRGTVKEMKYFENCLYVRCSDNTLHIFDRLY